MKLKSREDKYLPITLTILKSTLSGISRAHLQPLKVLVLIFQVNFSQEVSFEIVWFKIFVTFAICAESRTRIRVDGAVKLPGNKIVATYLPS